MLCILHPLFVVVVVVQAARLFLLSDKEALFDDRRLLCPGEGFYGAFYHSRAARVKLGSSAVNQSPG